ncbi:MAG: cytochrome c biogenesis protein CcdA [Endomicrobium sp.]|jgi:cytochrome c-type biogenesis protein|nr:cytochrome c biogenesis protein CcdA [Endomicrobium sp.]
MEKISFFAAFAAGFLAFISPCILPLIPAFISLITGLSLNEINSSKKTVFLKTLIFILGFSSVFIMLGMSAGALGGFFEQNRNALRIAGGIIVIIFGLHIAGVFKIGFLNRQFSLNGTIERFFGKSGFAAFFTGCAFALGWTPCIGPVLASILMLASGEGNVFIGFWLLTFFSLGLTVPFILTAVFIDRFVSFFGIIKKYYRQIEIISGILLICVGILLINDGFFKITTTILQFAGGRV